MSFRFFTYFSLVLLNVSCAIEFQVASQRTAIENQILGAYEEIDQDIVLLSSVRALDQEGNKKELQLSSFAKKATSAKQNQQFNKDDIVEFKKKSFVGEGLDGELKVIGTKITGVKEPAKSKKNLIEIITEEENRDRSFIWLRVIEKSPDLKESDIDLVRQNYRQKMVSELETGFWFQNDEKEWVQKK